MLRPLRQSLLALFIFGCLERPEVTVLADTSAASAGDADHAELPLDDTAAPGSGADGVATDADLSGPPELPASDALSGDTGDGHAGDADTGNTDVAEPAPGCTLAELQAQTGCAPLSGGFDTYNAVVADWNGDGCDDVLVPRSNAHSVLVIYGDVTRSLSCTQELPLEADGEPIAPYQLLVGQLCGSEALDAYVIGLRDGVAWMGRAIGDGDGGIAGALVGGPIPAEAFFVPGAQPSYGRLAALDNSGPPDALFGDIYTNILSVLGDCGAGFALLSGRFSMDPPTVAPPREVHLVEVLESPRRVFTAGAFTASLHDVDGKGNLVNPSYASLDATDGYDAYALTPHPPAGRLEVLAALEFDVVYTRYDVSGALWREQTSHGAAPEPVGTPDFAFVLDPDPNDGVFELLFVDTAGNDSVPRTLAVHWFRAVGLVEGALTLGTLVTQQWDKESEKPGFMAQDVVWAELDGQSPPELLLLGQSGDVVCLHLGNTLSSCAAP